MIRRRPGGRRFQHKPRPVQGIQHMRVLAFFAQHAQRVNHQIRVAGEAQFIGHGSGIRAGLDRDHQVDRIRHPIHLYSLPHIVVVEKQVFWS